MECTEVNEKVVLMFMAYRLKILALFLLLLPVQTVSGADVPHRIAGIEIGKNVEEYPGLKNSNYLEEAIVMDRNGFRKGIISYGTCKTPGLIVGLRMKYEDSSEAFFDTLLQRYTAKYGPPEKWKGDSFGIKHIWKWRFADEAGRRINMILQHNLQDDDATIGNQVKLSLPELIEEEHRCFLQKNDPAAGEAEMHGEVQQLRDGWERLLPQ